jgi:hypothetical protein
MLVSWELEFTRFDGPLGFNQETYHSDMRIAPQTNTA